MKVVVLFMASMVVIQGAMAAEKRTDNMIFPSVDIDEPSDDLRNFRNQDTFRNTQAYRNNGNSYRNSDDVRNIDNYRNFESQRNGQLQNSLKYEPSPPIYRGQIRQSSTNKIRPTSMSDDYFNEQGANKGYQGNGYYVRNGATSDAISQPEVSAQGSRGNGMKSWNGASTNGRYRNGNGGSSNGNGAITYNRATAPSNGNGRQQPITIMGRTAANGYNNFNLVATDYRTAQDYSSYQSEQTSPASGYSGYPTPTYASYSSPSYGTTGYVLAAPPAAAIGVTYGQILPTYSTGYVGYGGISTDQAPIETAALGGYSAPTPFAYSAPVHVSYSAPVHYASPLPVAYAASPLPVAYAAASAAPSGYSEAYASSEYPSQYQPPSDSSVTNGSGEDYTVLSSTLQVNANGEGSGNGGSSSGRSAANGNGANYRARGNNNLPIGDEYQNGSNRFPNRIQMRGPGSKY